MRSIQWQLSIQAALEEELDVLLDQLCQMDVQIVSLQKLM